MQRTIYLLILGGALALAACGGSSPETPVADTPAGAATGPTLAPTTGPPPDPFDILQRSGEAMANAAPFRVESARWPANPSTEDLPMVVKEYLGEELHYASIGANPPECGSREVWDPPFTRREDGALASYRGQPGATAPEVIELLDAGSIGGPDTWIVRYRFTWPSIEGPVPVERTEWIDPDTLRLLRVEEEQFDPLGWIGQEVMAFSYEVTADEACALSPRLSGDELTPVTEPRLEDPSAQESD